MSNYSHITVESDSKDEPYADQIRRWFLRTLPGSTAQAQDNLEVIFEAFMASSKIRLGPRPSPESQVEIRNVIRFYQSLDRRIPVLVPWGSEKPDAGDLDIAEVAGLRTLYDLADRVQVHYPKGLDIRIRIEDASAPHLFYTRAEDSKRVSAEYTQKLVSLIKLFGPPITPVPESTIITTEAFAAYADTLVPLFQRYIEETDLYGLRDYEYRESYQELAKIGWKGNIPMEQRDYYRNTYAKLYDIDPHGERATHTLARYMAEAITRGKVGATGASKMWEGGHIQVSLVAPVPGAPIERTGRTIYYRTLPENIASTHMPPWRARGYLQSQEDGSFKPKLTTVRALPELHEAYATLCGNGQRVNIRTDYTV